MARDQRIGAERARAHHLAAVARDLLGRQPGAVGRAIGSALDALAPLSREELREARAQKFLAIGRKL